MKKHFIVRDIHSGKEFVVTAEKGETYHTEDGRYILRRRTDEIMELIPAGEIHVVRLT